MCCCHALQPPRTDDCKVLLSAIWNRKQWLSAHDCFSCSRYLIEAGVAPTALLKWSAAQPHPWFDAMNFFTVSDLARVLSMEGMLLATQVCFDDRLFTRGLGSRTLTLFVPRGIVSESQLVEVRCMF